MNTTISCDEFRNKFRFRREGGLLVGCEREFFLTNGTGEIKPLSPVALTAIADKRFGYELSACQMEAHIGPTTNDGFHEASLVVHNDLRRLLSEIGMQPLFQTIGPADMPLDIYPDPTGRYQRITTNMPREILSAACRVTGTHFHIGMPDHETALRVYNGVIPHLEELCQIGNLTNGERRAIYHVMAKDNMSRPYRDWADMFDFYVEQGYVEDPRKCWHLIRMSVHGTIEFRMFDNTDDLDLVSRWADRCYGLCAALI